MVFRLVGFLFLAIAAAALWYVRPDSKGKHRYPPRFNGFVEHILPVLICIVLTVGVLLIAFGPPDTGATFNRT